MTSHLPVLSISTETVLLKQHRTKPTMSSSGSLSARELCPSLCLQVVMRLCHADVASLCLRNFLTPRSLMFDWLWNSFTDWILDIQTFIGVKYQWPKAKDSVSKRQLKTQQASFIFIYSETRHSWSWPGWLCYLDNWIWLEYMFSFDSKRSWLHNSSYSLPYSFPFHCSLDV